MSRQTPAAAARHSGLHAAGKIEKDPAGRRLYFGHLSISASSAT